MAVTSLAYLRRVPVYVASVVPQLARGRHPRADLVPFGPPGDGGAVYPSPP
jgi:hypothetical protein